MRRADPKHRRCLNPELAKKFNIDSWYNTEDGGGQHYTLPGNHGLLDGVTLADERAKQRETQTSTSTGAPVLWLWIPSFGFGRPRNAH